MAFNFWGIPSTIEKLPIQEPAQQAGINQLFQQGLQNYNPDIQEKYATEQFAKRIPGIAERLNMLSGGRGMSQAAQYELGGLSKDLQSQLAGLRYQAGLNQLKLGLTPQYEYLYRGEQPGLLEAGAQGLASSLGQAIPGLAGKGAEYLANKFAGPAGEAAGSAAAALAPAGIEALKSAFPSPQAPATGAAPQDVGKLAQAATLLKKAGPEAAAAAAPSAIGALKAAGTAGATTGAAEVAKQAAAQAVKPGFIDTAAAVAKYGAPAAGAAVIAKGVYGMIRDEIQDRRGPQPAPLPANWHEMTGRQRSEYQGARQISTPQGIIGHDAIRRMEYDLGIQPNEKLSWQERYANIVAKKGRK